MDSGNYNLFMEFLKAVEKDFVIASDLICKNLPSDPIALIGPNFISLEFLPQIQVKSDLIGCFDHNQMVALVIGHGQSQNLLPKTLLIKKLLKTRPNFNLLRNIFNAAIFEILFNREKNSYSIDWIVVDRDSQGHGIGSQLLRIVAEQARKQGYSKLRVRTLQATPNTLDFYKKNGFKVRTVAFGRVLLVNSFES